MLRPNKANITIFSYIIFSVIAVSLFSYIAEKSETYFIMKFVIESPLGATQQEVINDILKMPGSEARSKLEKIVTAIAIIKLSVNAFILYLCSCFIVRKLSKSNHNNLSEFGAQKVAAISNET